MPKYIAYEVWTKAEIVEASDIDEAYSIAEPTPLPGLALSNWHVVEIPDVSKETE